MMKNMIIKFAVWSVLGATLVGLCGGAETKVPQAPANGKGDQTNLVVGKKTSQISCLPSPFSELKDPKRIEEYIGSGYVFPDSLGKDYRRKSQWQVDTAGSRFFQLDYKQGEKAITLRIHDPKEMETVTGDYRHQPTTHQFKVGNKKINANGTETGILNAHWDEGGKRYTLIFDQAVTKQGLAEIVHRL